ncbi:MAG: antiterminator Q family protein [[Pasteurella] aerogenes]|nr:antiterminator Q family protein [[Pasteurella] aerogenes]
MNFKAKFRRFGYWGKSRLEMDYPVATCGIKGAARTKPFLDPLSDDEGMVIDGGLLLMKKINFDQFHVFMLTYVERYDRVDICRIKHISDKKRQNLLRQAENFLKGYLLRGDVLFFA